MSCAPRPGTCCGCSPPGIPAASWRYGSRRWRPCNACPGRSTPGARRRTWWRPTRLPGSGWPPAGSAGPTRSVPEPSTRAAPVLTSPPTCLCYEYTDLVASRGGRLTDELASEDRPPREACGVFGVWAPGEDVAKLAYYGLYTLQHRGQESAGIAVSDGSRIMVHKEMGLVAQVFDEGVLGSLHGHIAVGHCRYSTSGSSVWENAQPTFRPTRTGGLALGHNGNLINTLELTTLVGPASARPGLAGTSDTDVLTTLFADP